MSEQYRTQNGFRSQIRDARQNVQIARNRYWREKSQATAVSQECQQDLATAALMYYDVLWEFVDSKQTVKQAWEEADLDRLKEWIEDDTVRVQEEVPGRTQSTKTVEKPKIVAVPPSELVSATKKLDNIANELGFAAEVGKDRPVGRIGDEEYYGDE